MGRKLRNRNPYYTWNIWCIYPRKGKHNAQQGPLAEGQPVVAGPGPEPKHLKPNKEGNAYLLYMIFGRSR